MHSYALPAHLSNRQHAQEQPGHTGSEDGTAAELERVLYAQMLVLFAPQAVATAAHMPLLTATLRASQPALRQAAAATLRHLAGIVSLLCFLCCPVQGHAVGKCALDLAANVHAPYG